MLDLENFGGSDKRLNIQLEATEGAILTAASNIFSAYIVSGKVTDKITEKEYFQKAIKQALAMANIVDDSVKAEGEM